MQGPIGIVTEVYECIQIEGSIYAAIIRPIA